MSVPSVRPQVLDFFCTPLVIEPSQVQRSSDAELLPSREVPNTLAGARQTSPRIFPDLR